MRSTMLLSLPLLVLSTSLFVSSEKRVIPESDPSNVLNFADNGNLPPKVFIGKVNEAPVKAVNKEMGHKREDETFVTLDPPERIILLGDNRVQGVLPSTVSLMATALYKARALEGPLSSSPDPSSMYVEWQVLDNPNKHETPGFGFISLQELGEDWSSKGFFLARNFVDIDNDVSAGYGKVFVTGDVVGCLATFEPAANRTQIYFWVNGRSLGLAYDSTSESTSHANGKRKAIQWPLYPGTVFYGSSTVQLLPEVPADRIPKNLLREPIFATGVSGRWKFNHLLEQNETTVSEKSALMAGSEANPFILDITKAENQRGDGPIEYAVSIQFFVNRGIAKMVYDENSENGDAKILDIHTTLMASDTEHMKGALIQHKALRQLTALRVSQEDTLLTLNCGAEGILVFDRIPKMKY